MAVIVVVVGAVLTLRQNSGLKTVASAPLVSPATVSTAGTSVASTTSTSTGPSSPYRTAPIMFTTPEGWTYQFTPNLGIINIRLTKDIQTSPPGKATLDISGPSSTAGSAFPGSVIGDTPGRLPPRLYLSKSSGLGWPLSATVATIMNLGSIAIGGPYCTAQKYSIAYFGCDLVNPATGLQETQPKTFTTGEMTEQQADELVSASSSFGQPNIALQINTDEDDTFGDYTVVSFTFMPNGGCTLSYGASTSIHAC